MANDHRESTGYRASRSLRLVLRRHRDVRTSRVILGSETSPSGIGCAYSTSDNTAGINQIAVRRSRRVTAGNGICPRSRRQLHLHRMTIDWAGSRFTRILIDLNAAETVSVC